MDVCPGIVDVRLLVAQTRYLSRDFDGAQSVLADAIALDSSHVNSHVLMAKIFVELERFSEANSSLEQALSHSFEVRESPLYFILRAQCHAKQKEWKQALSILQDAIKLPGIAIGASQEVLCPQGLRVGGSALGDGQWAMGVEGTGWGVRGCRVASRGGEASCVSRAWTGAHLC
jgi:tetratricopeptide (TPR) repeat protein